MENLRRCIFFLLMRFLGHCRSLVFGTFETPWKVDLFLEALLGSFSRLFQARWLGKNLASLLGPKKGCFPSHFSGVHSLLVSGRVPLVRKEQKHRFPNQWLVKERFPQTSFPPKQNLLSLKPITVLLTVSPSDLVNCNIAIRPKVHSSVQATCKTYLILSWKNRPICWLIKGHTHFLKPSQCLKKLKLYKVLCFSCQLFIQKMLNQIHIKM